MKSLYNKSGILPSLFTNSRVDCGISWSEHRSQHPAGNARMKLQVSCGPAAISAAYDKEISAIEWFKKAITETLKPIDPQTIQVGDTVRLVGSRTITEWPHGNLEVGKDYKVIECDKDCGEGMSISVSYNSFGGYFWIYDEDLMLVESV